MSAAQTALTWACVAHEIVAAVYMPAALVLFYRRRQKFPLNGLDLVSTMVAGLGSMVAVLTAASLHVLIGGVLAAASVAVDALLLQVAVLYAKAALSHDRVGLAHVQSQRPIEALPASGAEIAAKPATLLQAHPHLSPDPDPNFALQTTLDQIWVLRQILTKKMAVLILVVTLGVTCAANVVLALQHPPLLRHTAYQCRTASCSLLISIHTAQVVITLAIVFVVTWRIRLMADPYGVRTGLGALIAVNLASWIVYASFAQSQWQDEWDPALIVLLAGQHAAFLLSVVRPLWRSYRPVFQSFQLTNGTMLDMFLVTPRHFQAFRDYLESEFSVENLLFWRSALEYHMSCTRMMMVWPSDTDLQPVGDAPELHLHQMHPYYNVAERLRYDAISIHRTYIEHGSPCQINISSGVHTRLTEAVAGVEKGEPGLVLDPNLFEEARLEIVQLLSYDSLLRFRETHRGQYLWDRFVVGSRLTTPNDSKISESQSSVHVQL